jgi:hypothetical protein
MSVVSLGQTIQIILAPVVMVTSCAILIGGMLTHYAAINDRLRNMTRERLSLLRQPSGALEAALANHDAYTSERLSQIDRQVPALLRRLHLIHNAIQAMYIACCVFLGSMLVIAIATISALAALATLALIVFLLGTGVMLAGIVVISHEIQISDAEVRYEATRVMSLADDIQPGVRP